MVVIAVIADSLWGSVSFNSHEVTGALSAYHTTTSPAVVLLTELYIGSRNGKNNYTSNSQSMYK